MKTFLLASLSIVGVASLVGCSSSDTHEDQSSGSAAMTCGMTESDAPCPEEATGADAVDSSTKKECQDVYGPSGVGKNKDGVCLCDNGAGDGTVRFCS